jgi:hypothetical protein
MSGLKPGPISGAGTNTEILSCAQNDKQKGVGGGSRLKPWLT